MPEISADGRVWKIRIRPGIYFADDPAFKGRKRELTADDYVYAFKRLLDPRMRAPFLWFLDGKIAGADEVLAKAKKAGRLDYDAADRRAEGARPLYAADHAEGAGLRIAGVSHANGDGGGRARGGRGVRRRVGLGDGESRRHRAVPAQGVAARAEDRAGGESRAFAKNLSRDRRAGRSRAGREDEGQATAAGRSRRHLDHRRIESAAPRVRERRARLRQRSRRSRRQRARSGQRAQARVRGQGCDAAPGDAAGAFLHVLQHGGPRDRRLHAGQDRAASGDDHGLQYRGDDQGLVAGPGARRHAADSAGSAGPQLRASSRARRTTRRRRRRCSTSSVTSIATRTAGATCRTASRSPW